MTIDKVTKLSLHCKDCRWWELRVEDPEVDGYGSCHHPIAFANYLLWWQRHPELHEDLNPPNAEGGFGIEGCRLACPVGETKD